MNEPAKAAQTARPRSRGDAGRRRGAAAQGDHRPREIAAIVMAQMGVVNAKK